MLPPPPRSTLFPYTTLFRSSCSFSDRERTGQSNALRPERVLRRRYGQYDQWRDDRRFDPGQQHGDRKSTRLNSSHVEISYAVFCLKKKKTMNALIRMAIVDV